MPQVPKKQRSIIQIFLHLKHTYSGYYTPLVHLQQRDIPDKLCYNNRAIVKVYTWKASSKDMPELPEVESTARQLRSQVLGATIRSVQVFSDRIIHASDTASFVHNLSGKTIEAVRRRGKYLLLDLSDDYLLVLHRRMTGNVILLPAGWTIDTSLRAKDLALWNTRGPDLYQQGQETTPTPKHLLYTRAAFTLTDNRLLLFTDIRKFGHLELRPRAQEALALPNLGPEPLGNEFTTSALAASLKKRKQPIKAALLDQAVVAGIGNIYADEALFLAGIHPLTEARILGEEELDRLRVAIIDVLNQGIRAGGTSFSDYLDMWGERGSNVNYLRVYQRTGQACINCGTRIEKITIGGRSTHICPSCQVNRTQEQATCREALTNTV